MRRQYFYWTYLVFGLVITIYGGYSIFTNLAKNKPVPILGIVFFIVGGVLLIAYLILYLLSLKKKGSSLIKLMSKPVVKEEEKKEEPKKEEDRTEKVIPYKDTPYKDTPYEPRKDTEYVRSSVSYTGSSGGSGYVKQMGYGPLLRINGNEILDMRNNTYYRIEGNNVNALGSGPVFEISGNRIREAFGSYLYEISGSNINKIYGGYYASISGNYITIYDLSNKYEMTDSFSKKQILVIAALLFGR